VKSRCGNITKGFGAMVRNEYQGRGLEKARRRYFMTQSSLAHWLALLQSIRHHAQIGDEEFILSLACLFTRGAE
jgi:hypothetical protein